MQMRRPMRGCDPDEDNHKKREKFAVQVEVCQVSVAFNSIIINKLMKAAADTLHSRSVFSKLTFHCLILGANIIKCRAPEPGNKTVT